ncbi:hypothetical protein P3T43_003798 [Paraburkholderia sp. GAS41]|jgi:hypothetical protein|uniref:Arm DNA-binding domain-containing protein n=1 Tax=Paraburkholderia sp. GAS41 TaxID=3035134 RepID=UPI003D2146D1
MARLHHALDGVQIRHWIAQKKPVAKADGDGLSFTLSANGTASWVLRYSRGTRRRELTLGKYPDLITLVAARRRHSTHQPE